MSQTLTMTIARNREFDLQRSQESETIIEDYATGSILHPDIGVGEIADLPTMWLALHLASFVALELLLISKVSRRVKLWVPEEEICFFLEMQNGFTRIVGLYVDGDTRELSIPVDRVMCKSALGRIVELINEEGDVRVKNRLVKCMILQYVLGEND